MPAADFWLQVASLRSEEAFNALQHSQILVLLLINGRAEIKEHLMKSEVCFMQNLKVEHPATAIRY